jgi:GNAT superfamily N-acetyltransferase
MILSDEDKQILREYKSQGVDKVEAVKKLQEYKSAKTLDLGKQVVDYARKIPMVQMAESAFSKTSQTLKPIVDPIRKAVSPTQEENQQSIQRKEAEELHTTPFSQLTQYQKSLLPEQLQSDLDNLPDFLKNSSLKDIKDSDVLGNLWDGLYEGGKRVVSGSEKVREAISPTEQIEEVRTPYQTTQNGITSIIPGEEIVSQKITTPNDEERLYKGVSGVFDMIGGGLQAYFSPVSATMQALPDTIEKPIQAPLEKLSEGSQFAGDKFMEVMGIDKESEQGKVITQGFQEFGNLLALKYGKKVSEPVAKTVGKGVSKAVEYGGKAVEKVIPYAEKGLEATKVGLQKTGEFLKKQDQSTKQKIAERLIQEKQTPGVLKEAFSEQGVDGLIKGKAKITNYEKQLASKLNKLVPDIDEGFFKGEKLRTNGIKIKNKKTELAKQVDKNLQSSGQALTTDTIKTQFNLSKNALEENGIFSTITGDASKIYDAMSSEYIRIFDKGIKDGKWNADVQGAWKARTAFDKWVETQRPEVFSTDKASAFNKGLKESRNTINDLIELNASGVGYKQFLQDYTKLSEVLDRMSTKVDMYNVAKLSGISTAIQKLRSIPTLTTVVGTTALIPLTGAIIPVGVAIGSAIYSLWRASVKTGRSIRSIAGDWLSRVETEAGKLSGTEKTVANNAIKQIKETLPQLQDTLPLSLQGTKKPQTPIGGKIPKGTAGLQEGTLLNKATKSVDDLSSSISKAKASGQSLKDFGYEIKEKPYYGYSSTENGGFVKLVDKDGKNIGSAEFLMKGVGDDRRGVLHSISIDESLRGKGLGKTFLDEVESMVKQRGGKQIKAQVVVNPEFFDKMGYKKSTGDGLTTMQKKL